MVAYDCLSDIGTCLRKISVGTKPLLIVLDVGDNDPYLAFLDTISETHLLARKVVDHAKYYLVKLQ